MLQNRVEEPFHARTSRGVRTITLLMWRTRGPSHVLPELLFLPGKISSRSVNQTGEFTAGVSPGKCRTHRHTCEAGFKPSLPALYNIRQGLYSGSARPSFSRVRWPRSGGLNNVYVSGAGQWAARPRWTQIRNWDKGGSVDAGRGKFGFTPRTIIIQDGKARAGTTHPPPSTPPPNPLMKPRTHS